MSYKNPFIVLGVNENCTQSEAYDAYIKLRDQYRMQRLNSGDEGRIAAEKLSELEDAYQQVTQIMRGRVTYGTGGLSDVEKLLKDNRIDEAQRMLDSLSDRNAEWHYLQAVVYLKKNWINECRSQLETAINMEPYNQKYQDSLNKLNAKTSNTTNDADRNSGFSDGAQYQNDPRTQQRSYGRGTRSSGCCDACTCALCTDCCCESMGGDCIPCC